MKSSGYRALLIDDDVEARSLAETAAECYPELDLVVLAGIDAALGWLRDGAGDGVVPDVILIDLKLPKLDGLALLRTIRNYPAMPSIPIIVFSSEHTPAEVLMSYRAGANSFVPKPCDEAQYGELFRAQFSYWAKPHGLAAAAMGDVAGRI